MSNSEKTYLYYYSWKREKDEPEEDKTRAIRPTSLRNVITKGTSKRRV